MTSPRFEHFDSNGTVGKRRRWLLGLEPIFEGGVKGKRAVGWNVEDELVAVAFLGDVTFDLSKAHLAGRTIAISDWAIVRDVEVIVPWNTWVELFGNVVWGDLASKILQGNRSTSYQDMFGIPAATCFRCPKVPARWISPFLRPSGRSRKPPRSPFSAGMRRCC